MRKSPSPYTLRYLINKCPCLFFLPLDHLYFKITRALAILLEHMHKKFEINKTKIKVTCQLGRQMVTSNSKSDLPLACSPPINPLVNLASHATSHLN